MAEEEIKETTEEITSTEEETNSQESSTKEDSTQKVQDDKNEEEKENTQKKVPLLNKILFGLVGFLLLTLITGAVLFFMGFFDQEEKPVTKEVQQKEKVIEEENKFNIKDINSKKLNKQLLLLTNKNIIEEEDNNIREKQEEEKKIKENESKKEKEALLLEEEKISKEKMLLENKKIELQRQKEELQLLKNEAIALRNEMINTKKALEIEKEEKIKEAIEEEIKEKNIVVKNKKEPMQHENKFVSLINVAKIKGELYKSYLDRITAINTNIKLCRDNLNRIEIYYGPFEENSARSELYKKLQENGIENSYEVELTKEEFDRRCNY